jgi:arylsulfatase A-like enzyme
VLAGVVSDQLLSTTDFLATIAGIIGENIPQGAAPDSYDLSPVLLDKEVNGWVRDQMIQHSIDGLFAIRQGNWKYTPVLGSGGFSKPKLIEPAPGEPNGALYDLSNDISETRNLISQHAELAQSLHDKLEEIAGQQF